MFPRIQSSRFNSCIRNCCIFRQIPPLACGRLKCRRNAGYVNTASQGITWGAGGCRARWNFGGKTVKNSSDTSGNLMIGSEGTLGVITRAVLKLVPLPGKTVSLLVPFADMEQAIGMVPVIVEAQIRATAIEAVYGAGRPSCFMKRNIWRTNGSRIPGMSAYILLTFDGRNAEQVRSQSTGRWRTCAWNTGAVWTCSSWMRRRGNRACGTPEGIFTKQSRRPPPRWMSVMWWCLGTTVADFIKYTHGGRDTESADSTAFGHAVRRKQLHVYLCRDDLAEAGKKN